MKKRNIIFTLALVAVSLLALVTNASAGTSVFATGLNNPRGLKFGPDGNLASLAPK